MRSFPLRGADRHTWEDGKEHDLIQLYHREASDVFSQWVIEKLVPLFHYYFGKHFKTNSSPSDEFTSYHDPSLYNLLSLVSTTIASVFPILAIVLLHLVTKTSARLAIIGAFTAAFSICLSLVTKARRIEVFAATAA